MTPRYDVFEKAPERKRRSVWNRVRRRPVMLGCLVMAMFVGLVGAVYVALRATHSLPAERRARHTVAIAQRLVASPDFEKRIVAPLDQYLSDNLVIASHPGPFADFIRRTISDELAVSPPALPPRARRSELIERWRGIMVSLDQREVHVYGLPRAIFEGDAWLRTFIAERMRTYDPALNAITASSAAVDLVANAVDRHYGLTTQELGGILFVADRAQRLRTPAAR